MTAAARTVLADCQAVLEMLEVEEDEQSWRVLWAGAMCCFLSSSTTDFALYF